MIGSRIQERAIGIETVSTLRRSLEAAEQSRPVEWETREGGFQDMGLRKIKLCVEAQSITVRPV